MRVKHEYWFHNQYGEIAQVRAKTRARAYKIAKDILLSDGGKLVRAYRKRGMGK